MKDYINNDHKFDKATMFGILCLIIVVSGLIGFIYEFVFYFFDSGMKTLYMRGGNFLPWINIYAIGALFIYFLTYKHRKKPLKVFLISLISCAVVEFIGGYLVYKIGNGFRCWDYNTEILNFGNIGGFICFRSVFFFGLSGLALMYLIVPVIFKIAEKLDKKTFLILSITLCSIFLIDEFYNILARFIDTPRASDIYKNIGFKYRKF